MGGGRPLVGYQFALHPGLRSVRSLVQEGAIGAVLSVHARRGEYLPGWHPWEDYHGFLQRSAPIWAAVRC